MKKVNLNARKERMQGIIVIGTIFAILAVLMFLTAGK
jgi:hypothetical protein